MCLEISYLLMAFFYQARNKGEKKKAFSSLHKFVLAEAEKMRVITVTQDSNPLSSAAVAACPCYIGVHVGMDNVGLFMQGIEGTL